MYRAGTDPVRAARSNWPARHGFWVKAFPPFTPTMAGPAPDPAKPSAQLGKETSKPAAAAPRATTLPGPITRINVRATLTPIVTHARIRSRPSVVRVEVHERQPAF